MKRFLIFVFALLLAVTACVRSGPELSKPSDGSGTPSQEAPEGGDGALRPEELLSVPAAERITEPGFLNEIWNGYVFDTFINIANGFQEFSRLEEIPQLELMRYLNIKMQRAGEDAGAWTPGVQRGDMMCYSLPREKLSEYCERYFGRAVDFTVSRGEQYSYDAEQDRVYFYPASTADSFEVLDYSSIAEWPYWRLNFVDRLDGEIYIANVSQTHVSSIDEMNELYTSNFILQRREDGSFYFLALVGVWPETHRVTLEGDYRELPYIKAVERGSFLCGGTEPDTAVFQQPLDGISLELTLVRLSTGEVLAQRTIEYPGETSIGFLDKRGDRIVAATGKRLGVYGLDLSEIRPFSEFPEELQNALGDDGQPRSLDFLPDLSRMSFVDDEGVKVYDFDTGKVTLVPGTEPYQPEGKIVAWTGYGSTMLVMGGEKVFAVKFGYEWTEGYLLYDLKTEESTYYPYGGGYGAGRIVTDTGALLVNHFERGNAETTESFHIDFGTGVVERQEESWEGETPFFRTGAGRYAVREQSGIVGDQMVKTTFLRIDLETGEETPLALTVTAPVGSVRVLGAADDGTAYVTVGYLGERYLLAAGA